MSENYQLVYQSRRKCEIYRDTGVSKNVITEFYEPNLICNIVKKSRKK